jgi:SAM-dependent methyltransferase
MNDPLAPIVEIMQRNRVTGSARDFHAAVNICFHRFESEVYDELHQDMWQSLPQQGRLLVGDCLRARLADPIRMLDIGCGTGLATDMILRTELGSRVVQVDLIDTSKAMLARADARRREWGKPGESLEGLVESLTSNRSYELIVTCSVLHHVPDLPSFLRAVAGLQSGISGAVFLHLQDPNGDFLNDPQLRERRRKITRNQLDDSIARFAPRRILGRVLRELKGEQGQDYLSKTNRELMRMGVMSKPLRAADIFAITDLHVRDGGISVDRMKEWLPDYDLAARRSYAFFGVLRSTLPPDLQSIEDQCIGEGALNGEYVAAAWRRR